MKLRRQGVEVAAAHERLKERGYEGSYASVYRVVRSLEPFTPEVTVRLRRHPGLHLGPNMGAVPQGGLACQPTLFSPSWGPTHSRMCPAA